jgi:hypothetical protein
MSDRFCRGLAAVAVAWCIGIGIWLWITPTGQPPLRFADVSALGPVPLVIPVAIAALGAWGAWRQHPVLLGTSVALMLIFALLAGFSIGAGYLPAAGALGWALVAQMDSRSNVDVPLER